MKMKAFQDNIKREVIGLINSIEINHHNAIIYSFENIKRTLHLLAIDEEIKKYKNVIAHLSICNFVEDSNANQIIYFANADPEDAEALAKHVLLHAHRSEELSIEIILVPQKSLLMEEILFKDYKLGDVFHKIKLTELVIDFVLLEETVLSFQLNKAFKQLYCDNYLVTLEHIAKVLIKLQTTVYGTFSAILAKGKFSVKVLEMIEHLEQEHLLLQSESFETSNPFRSVELLIIDRDIDVVTPMLTQCTFEGLLTELYKLNDLEATLPFELSDELQSTTRQNIISLSNDEVFESIRNKNFSEVGPILYRKSVEIKECYDKRKSVHEIKELKEFMKKLPQIQENHKQVAIHTSIATQIRKTFCSVEFRRRLSMEQNCLKEENKEEFVCYIKELICKREKFSSVLRLLCLYSTINNGLRLKEYEEICYWLMLAYGGPKVLSALLMLEKCNLITKRSKNSNSDVQQINKIHNELRIESQISELKERESIATPYNGYVSLLIRIIMSFIRNKIHNGQNQFRIMQKVNGEMKISLKKNAFTSTRKLDSRTIVICVVGGLTASELSELRLAQRQYEMKKGQLNLIICVTSVIDGNQLIESMTFSHSTK